MIYLQEVWRMILRWARIPRVVRLPPSFLHPLPNLVLPDHLAPALELLPDIGTEFFRRAGDRVAAHRNQLVFDVGCVERAYDFCVQLVDDRARGRPRREDA